MTKYKVGDVAALFSKPKNPTTTAGKKLQSLFEDYYSKNSKSTFHSQEENYKFNKNGETEILNDQSASKKSKKRKFSSLDDSELNENVSSKKFKALEHEDSKSNENKKLKKIKKQKDFSEKNNNDSELNSNVYLEKFKESPKSSKINKDKKFKKKFKMQNVFPRNNNNDLEFNDKVFSKNFKESPKRFKDNKDDKLKNMKKQDFPRKNKQRFDSFTNKSMLQNFEVDNVSENDLELPPAIMVKNGPKDTKKNKNFIKKSKKRSLDDNSSKLSTDSFHKDFYDSDDASLKKEIEEFMHSNSEELEIENKNGNNNQEKTFNSKGQGIIKKPKKKFLSNQDSFAEKYEESSEQNVKSKKMNKRNNDFQQSFPRTKKESKPNSFNFSNKKSEINHDNVEQNSASKKQNSIDPDHVKKSKKFKDRSNSAHNSFIASENNSEANTSMVKGTAVDFIRKPKNKKNGGDAFNTDNLKKSNNKVFGNVNADKNFKNEGDNISNGIQKLYANDSAEETLEGIKLPSLGEENDEKNFEERLSRTLFVGNLPKNTSKREVKNLFCAFGKIEGIRLAGVETDKAKIYSKNPPKLLHSNYASDTIPGFIVFADKQSAVEALSLSGCVFKDHHITVDFAIPAGTHKLYDDKRSIFIGNLPFDVKDESVWNAFKNCGRIEGVRVVRDRNTGLGKGFGYVLFSTVESKQNAMSLEGLNIEGREIRIKAVDSNKKVQKSDSSPFKRDTFKSRAIRLKKNSNVTGSHKSIRKLTNKQKILHKKKKISTILQKAMK